MFLLDNFIITQKNTYLLLGFLILFLGTIFNFLFSGLLNKKSGVFSNFVVYLSLIGAAIFQLPAFFGFLNTSGLKNLSYFNDSLILNSSNLFLCICANLLILLVFSTSFDLLKKLRHKKYYFNSLYLCSALALNILILSQNIIVSLLAFEAIFICAFFILLGFKTKETFIDGFRYIVLSVFSTALIFLSLALSNALTVKNSLLITISQLLLYGAIIFKTNLHNIFDKNINFPALTFLNTVTYSSGLIMAYKTSLMYLKAGCAAQFIFIFILTLLMLVYGLKLTRVSNLENFLSKFNSLNFCAILILFFTLTPKTSSAALTLLINTQIITLALINIFSILKANTNSLEFTSIQGICHINKKLFMLLSTVLFVLAGLVPTGVLTSRIYSLSTLSETGLWSSVVSFAAILAYTLLIVSTLKLSEIMLKRPAQEEFFNTNKYAKRTKLNYFILFICLILCFLTLIINSDLINLTTSFQSAVFVR